MQHLSETDLVNDQICEALARALLQYHAAAWAELDDDNRPAWARFVQRHRAWGGHYAAWFRGNRVFIGRCI